MAELCSINGIIQRLTSPYNTQSNGVAETTNQTPMKRARPLIFKANLKNSFWEVVVKHAEYIHNCAVGSSSELSPFENLTKKKPNVASLKIFGCTAFVKYDTVSKPRQQAEALIYAGNEGTRTFIVFDPKTRKVKHVRQAKFDETEFPRHEKDQERD